MLKVSYRTLLYKIERYHLRASSAPQFSEQILAGNGNRVKGNGTGAEWIKPVEPSSE
jgi:hypothetical protein